MVGGEPNWSREDRREHGTREPYVGKEPVTWAHGFNCCSLSSWSRAWLERKKTEKSVVPATASVSPLLLPDRMLFPRHSPSPRPSRRCVQASPSRCSVGSADRTPLAGNADLCSHWLSPLRLCRLPLRWPSSSVFLYSVFHCPTEELTGWARYSASLQYPIGQSLLPVVRNPYHCFMTQNVVTCVYLLMEQLFFSIRFMPVIPWAMERTCVLQLLKCKILTFLFYVYTNIGQKLF